MSGKLGNSRARRFRTSLKSEGRARELGLWGLIREGMGLEVQGVRLGLLGLWI